MANIVQIEVDYITQVLEVYDQIKVYKAETADGNYVEATGEGTRIVMNAQDNLYRYTDIFGTTDFYKTSYFNSDNSAESPMSGIIAGASDSSIQLTQNMQVVIELDPTILNLLGQSIGEQTFYFTTPCNPYYSSIRKVRLEVGAFIQPITDDTLNLAIMEASIAADQLSWFKHAATRFSDGTGDFFKFARREWVTCTASQYLMQNYITGLKSKRLDNLEVEYELIKPAQIMLTKVQACIDKWEKQIKSGGNAVQKPVGVVKGELDPEDAHVGRMWEKGPGVQKTSMSNLRYRPFGARRYVGGYRRNFNRMT